MKYHYGIRYTDQAIGKVDSNANTPVYVYGCAARKRVRVVKYRRFVKVIKGGHV